MTAWFEDNSLSIGRTPLVRLNRVTDGAKATVLAKIEGRNPAYSVKCRLGAALVWDAEKKGLLGPGKEIVEPTSGNTGIALAFVAASRGIPITLTMPETMSIERRKLLLAYGAKLVLTEGAKGMNGAVAKAEEIVAGDPGRYVLLQQFKNPANPAIHEATTGPEIFEDTGGKVDIFVAGVGTGGTITGVARAVKKRIPNCKIIGVDPEGSILAGPGPIKSYKVEGIGYDFIPKVLDRSLVDEWVKTEDRPSFLMARRLIRQEGLLCGGSSGSAMWAAREMAKKYGPKKRIVVLLPDSVRNYMTKFMDPQWMKENGFTESAWETNSIGDTLRQLPRRKLVTCSSADTIADSVMQMKEHGISQLPVVDDGRLVGIVTESDVLGKLVEGRATLASSVAEVMFRKVVTVKPNDDASKLVEIFGKGLVGLVVDDAGTLQGIITKLDLVDLLTAKPAVEPRA